MFVDVPTETPFTKRLYELPFLTAATCDHWFNLFTESDTIAVAPVLKRKPPDEFTDRYG